MTTSAVRPNGPRVTSLPDAMPAAELARTEPLSSFEPAGARRTGQAPLDVSSTDAQQSVRLAQAELARTQPLTARDQLQVRSVVKDDLGMTHVKVDRFRDGVRVFGEQAIVHLNADGTVARVTGELQRIPDSVVPTLESFGPDLQGRSLADRFAQPGDKATFKRVIAPGADGALGMAYQIECVNLESEGGPRRQNYLVDAVTGDVLKQWNQVGGLSGDEIDRIKALRGSRSLAAADRAPLASAEASAAPGAPVNHRGKVESTIRLDGSFEMGELYLDLDIDHFYQKDLIITLTSPSGHSEKILDRDGNHNNDVKQTFDLTDKFAGEPLSGDWKITVEDMKSGDDGRFNNWRLRAVQKDPNPPPTPPRATDDQSIYSGLVEIDATQTRDGDYRLLDQTRGRGIETRNANHLRLVGTEIRDANNVWGEATDTPDNAAAVDAQYGLQTTYDFMRDVLGTDSIDGKGAKLTANVHVGREFTGAYWDGTQMMFGDGDFGDSFNVLTSLDITGHEIIHGLNQHTADLIYEGESGGLSESFSDILGGAGVEWYALQRNPALEGKVNPFYLAEQAIGTDGGQEALRYMDDPTRDGYSMDNFSGFAASDKEVHRTSGIANNAFYLLVNGGTNRTSGAGVQGGIGMEKGLKIFGRALMNYMTESTTFAQARAATIAAATDLYGAGSEELQKVMAAWSAVGVQ